MNFQNSQRLAAHIGSIALLLLGAACSRGAGSPPTSNLMVPAVQSRPTGNAAHGGQKLYVSTIDGGSVVVYSAGLGPQLLQTITDGVPRPNGVWVDKRGALYAVNVPGPFYQTSLPEYRPRATSPFKTITNGIVNASNVAVDDKENVYVTGIDTANESFFLEIYPKGQLSPSETLTIPHTGDGDPVGLAFDSTGALLVGESFFNVRPAGVVYRLPPGSQSFTNLGLHKINGGAIAVDAAGNLYVGGNESIVVFPPNSNKPSRIIKVFGTGISALAIDAGGNLYVGMDHSVSVYEPLAKKPTTTFDTPGHVGGLALSP